MARVLGTISASASAETPNDAASTAKAGAEPAEATRMPPRAGPSSEPNCTAAELSAFPACSQSGLSRDGMMVNEAGMKSPSPAPSKAAIGPSVASDTMCFAANTASTTTSPQRTRSAVSMIVRGPSLSASTPPSGMSTVRGKP